MRVIRGRLDRHGRDSAERSPDRNRLLPNGDRVAALAEITDDPAARQRELAVVLQLCAAQARGARERCGAGHHPTLSEHAPGARHWTAGSHGERCD